MIPDNFLEALQFTKEERKRITEHKAQKAAALSPYAAQDAKAVYACPPGWSDYRTHYAKDIDSILNNVFYARFGDKTQVHSFYENDDVTRRSLHVQYVSRIARSIGGILDLNLELIEAIAIGHDIGHTPFGHQAERFLSALYQEYDGKHFHHNAHSVRVLKDISKRKGRGLSLQTLDGILSHNGEYLTGRLQPSRLDSFSAFEEKHAACYTDPGSILTHVPNTLEGCLVRICDIVAYVGKDRQDLLNVGLQKQYNRFADRGIGITNTQIISNVATNLIKNSYNKPVILLDHCVAEALARTKADNNEIIYNAPDVVKNYDIVNLLIDRLFRAAYKDLKNGTDHTYIVRNFLDAPYLDCYRADIQAGLYTHADITVDYIASMTDDYLIRLAQQLGYAETIDYTGYF